jgi:hypothetical protein
MFKQATGLKGDVDTHPHSRVVSGGFEQKENFETNSGFYAQSKRVSMHDGYCKPVEAVDRLTFDARILD